ncbi:MAG: hypothetical protein H8E98_03100 [Bacteroidetes bacterium]|nr:hypothetical protein [Bacteroidota bacterium]
MKKIKFRAYDLKELKYWDFIEVIDFSLEIITVIDRGDEYPTELQFKDVELQQLITS